MKGILFNTDMVRAILDGRKTVTRRPIKKSVVEKFVISQDGILLGSYDERHPEWNIYPTLDDCPYQPGSIIYVRETWKQAVCDPAGGGYALTDLYLYKADEPINTEGMDVEDRWHPSIHMPKEAVRIFLRVTGIKVQRVKEITEDEAIAEGFASRKEFISDFLKMYPECTEDSWVWVIAFERISKEDAQKGGEGNE